MKLITMIFGLIFLVIGCKTEIKEYPLINAVKLAETHPTFVDLKAIVIEIQNGEYLAFTNKMIIDSMINNFEVIKTIDCLKFEKEEKKWQDKIMTDLKAEPFAYRNEFFGGDLVFSAKDRNHCIGISYCIDSKTNIKKFKSSGFFVMRKDTILKDSIELQKIINSVDSSGDCIIRFKSKIEISYYKRID